MLANGASAAVFLLKASVIISFILAGIVAFLLVMNMMLSLIMVTFNQNVFTDIFSLVTIWLPFNLEAIWLWLTTAAFAFLAYRITMVAYTWVARFITAGGSD